ncbi:MAG: methyltransferase domain-containing protein [Acidobacteria bacterium]|nr:methyltransferase domain-containing protein [Acidobacteriota bacterium]
MKTGRGSHPGGFVEQPAALQGGRTMPDPSIILDLATAYRGSAVLLTASRLNLFGALSSGPLSAGQVAERCGLHPRPAEMLLNACVAHRLLEREDRLYRNTEMAEAFLVPGRPSYAGDALRYSEDLYPVWGRLAATVRSNAPALPPEDLLGSDPEKTRNFVLAMHNRALGIAAVLPSGINLEGRRQLFDVGGGPGTYSILLVQQTPGLRAIVLDLPPVARIAREIIASYGCADRIEVMPGDYTQTEFREGNDVVLMSGMLHRETPEICQILLQKAFRSLQPGGLVVTSDVFFDTPAKDSPPFATLFALNMMLTSLHGSAHASAEMSDWMRQAGFARIEVKPLPPPNPHTLILGTKP